MSKMTNDMVLFGWTVVVMGSLFSVAGVAALWGYDVTLGFFTEEVVSFRGRLLWIACSVVSVALGAMIIGIGLKRRKKEEASAEPTNTPISPH
jgi:hypothetical protein